MAHGQCQVESETGKFRIEDMPVGPVKLKAYSRLAGWIEGPVVELKAGEETQVEILYTGPDNSRRIVVIPTSRPFFTFEREIEGITLRGEGIEPRQAVRAESSPQFYSFDDLPPGRYTIEIKDPRFQPWKREDVEPGTCVEAPLKGNAVVRLEIVDAKSGVWVTPTTIHVRFDGTSSGSGVFQILGPGQPMPPEGTFVGMLPLDQTLIVKAERYADCEVPVAGLDPDGVRKVTARMTRLEVK